MRSNLFIIPSEIAGWSVFGFGLLLALQVVLAGGWAAIMWRKPNGREEVLAALPVLGLIAAAIIFLPRFFPEGFPIRGYGVMLIVAAVSGFGLANRRARQVGLSTDLLLSLAFWMFVCGIVGGRVFYVIEYWEDVYAPLPLGEAIVEALKYANGGLVVYGALAGATVAFVVFMLRHRLPVLAMADLVAPSLVVGLAFGRVGCLLNGCCFGGVADVPWAVTFPQVGQSGYSPPYAAQLARGELLGMRLQSPKAAGEQSPSNGVMVARVYEDSVAAQQGIRAGDVVTHVAGKPIKNLGDAAAELFRAMGMEKPIGIKIAGRDEITLPAQRLPQRSLPVHPTQLYSAINAGLIALFLWSYYPARRRDGEVFALLITIYPVSRFLLEKIRVDETSFFGTGLSISQNVSLLLLALVAALWIYLWRQPAVRVFDPPLSGPLAA